MNQEWLINALANLWHEVSQLTLHIVALTEEVARQREHDSQLLVVLNSIHQQLVKLNTPIVVAAECVHDYELVMSSSAGDQWQCKRCGRHTS